MTTDNRPQATSQTRMARRVVRATTRCLLTVGVATATLLGSSHARAATLRVPSLTIPGVSAFDSNYPSELSFVNIAADYGAPPGLGSSAVTLDTPGVADRAEIAFGVNVGGDPTPYDLPPLRTTEISDLSYYAFRSSASTAEPSAAPRLLMSLWVRGLGEWFTYYDPADNRSGVFPQDTWTRLDAIQGGDALWRVVRSAPDGTRYTVLVPWRTLVEMTTFADAGPAFLVRLHVLQGPTLWATVEHGGLYAAVDGLMLNTLVLDFETFIPAKDDCKDGGWATSWPAGTFKNQGDCISHFAHID
jgi:hypothetical protein